MKKNILITGGAGFIGINAAASFIKEGWDVTILDNLSRKGTHLNLKWLGSVAPRKFKFVKADVMQHPEVLAREASGKDAIVHLAAQVAVTASVVNPRKDFEINAIGTHNVLEAIRNLPGKKPLIIYSSTNKVYGDLAGLKISENKLRYELKDYPAGINEGRQLDFHSPYGCSKGTADQYVRDYARIYGLNTVVFRQSCIYGRRQFGIEDQGWVAWLIIAALLKKPITLYGNGKQVRDILFIDDLTSLYSAAIKNASKVSGNIYNIGGGYKNSISLLELFIKLKSDHDLLIRYNKGKIRPGDQKIFISDNSKIQRDLGWRPEINLNRGIAELYGWTRDNLNLIKSLYR